MPVSDRRGVEREGFFSPEQCGRERQRAVWSVSEPLVVHAAASAHRRCIGAAFPRRDTGRGEIARPQRADQFGRQWRRERMEAPRLLSEARTRKRAEVSRRHHRQMGDHRRQILRTHLPAVALQAPQHLFLTAAVSDTSPSTTSTAGGHRRPRPRCCCHRLLQGRHSHGSRSGRQAWLLRVALRDSAWRACPLPTP